VAALVHMVKQLTLMEQQNQVLLGTVGLMEILQQPVLFLVMAIKLILQVLLKIRHIGVTTNMALVRVMRR